jgi:hypothetical protein
MGRRAGRCERASFCDDIILQILNDQRRLSRIEFPVGHVSS